MQPLPKSQWSPLLRIVFSHKSRFIKVAESHDLSPGMAGMILRMDEGGSSMQAMAARLFCDKSNVTGLVNRLSKRKLVSRAADPNDRRSTLVTLTPHGRRIRKAMKAELSKPPKWLNRLTPSERKTLLKLLEKAVPLEK